MGVFHEDAEPFDLSKAPQTPSSAVSADDYDYDDDLEDALPDDVDFVIELHREDGVLTGSALNWDLANDFEELVSQLQRVPGDAGSIGFVSVDGEFFVIVRVRGQVVQVVLSDATACGDWPIARDIVDYLGEDIDEDDDSLPIGDFSLLVDSGLAAFELEHLSRNYDDDSYEVVRDIAERIKVESVFDLLVDPFDQE